MRTLLLVEDSHSVRTNLVDRLENEPGYRVLPCASLAETREALDRPDALPQLAVVDLNLPDAPRGEALKLTLSHGIPSLVLTARLEAGERARLIEEGVAGFVLKSPRAADLLVARVRRLLANRHCTVLVVDDSSAARATMTGMLERVLFKTVEADSARAALRILAERPDVRLVVVDHLMQGMDGVELTARIRELRGPDEPAVIGVSSTGILPLSVRFLTGGASDFIRKPFEPEEFACRCENAVASLDLIARLKEAAELKNRFLGTAAHDLRGPIGSMGRLAEVLMDDLAPSLSPDQREVLEVIRDGAERMLALVSDLLDVSIIESGHLALRPRPTDLAALLRERARIMRLAAGAKATSIRLEAPDHLDALLDPDRFGQVLDNLLSNAVKFSPPGSLVTTKLTRDTRKVRIEVADQGPGITPAEQEQLFRDFRKLSAKPTGGEPSTGLGLAIARRIVEAHGGSIGVESREGAGAVFHVSLPT